MAIQLTDDLSQDEILTAYLDGALRPEDENKIEARLETDPDLAMRLMQLERAIIPAREAFDALLDEAPTDRLKSALAAQIAQAPDRRDMMRGLLAAGIAGVAVGIGGSMGYSNLRRSAGDAAPRRWREAVAGYMSLYTPATFGDLGDSEALHIAQFQRLSSAIGVALSETAITLPGVAFRRAELLRYDSLPLGQVGYVDPEYGPMAFCLKPADFGSSALISDRTKGMNIVYWASARHAFLVIGRSPDEKLRGFAAQLQQQIDT